MAKAHADDETKRMARELVAAGCSYRDAAETLGVTAPTIQRWVKGPAPKPPAPPSVAPARASEPPPEAPTIPVHMAPVVPPVPVNVKPLDLTDGRAIVRQLIAEQHAAIQADRAAGNMRGASGNAATLERLVKSLKQMEQGAAEDSSAIKIARSDITAIKDNLRERVAAICNRPLLCAGCSRALSVFWGTGTKPASDA